MSNTVKCPSCGSDVVPMALGNKNFCPECEAEIIDVKPAVAESPNNVAEKPVSKPSEGGHVIKDGMGMIEENRTKIGAVETFSDNSVTNHTNTTNTTTNTTNISNVTNIADDTKKSVVCEISGKKVLITSSVVCPVCGKTVSEQYYDEDKLRCVQCEKKAVEAYEKFYKEMTAGSRVIDKELREVLDAKAKSFKLTDTQMKESELKLRKNQSDKQDRLSDIQQKDFDRTLKQLKEGKIDAEPCLNKLTAYAKLTDDASVQCWYWLLKAVAAPENYMKDLKNATIDNYWQTYWGFVAAMQMKNTTEAVLCVDNAKSKYPDCINDITLAQAYLEFSQYIVTKDESYLADAENDVKCVVETETRCLQEFRERLKSLLGQENIPSMGIDKILLLRQVQSQPAAGPQKSTSPQKPAASQTSPVKPTQSSQQSQSAKPAQESKGYTLNTAGGPLNPTVTSFSQAAQPKKKSGGKWIAVAAVIAVVAVGAFIFTQGSDDKDAIETKTVEAVETPAQASAPVATPTPAVTSTPDPSPTPVQTAAPEAKPAPKQSMAARAAGTATQASSASPQSDVLTQGLEAYKKGNYKEAHDLFKRAATAGNAEACYQLGLMLSTGKGTVAKNPLQGKVWIKKAAGLGHAEAKKALETM